jgi:hypothetical protein
MPTVAQKTYITPAEKASLLKQAKKLAEDIEDAKIAAKCADRVEDIVKRACNKLKSEAFAEKADEPEPVVRAGITGEARDRRLTDAARRAQASRRSIQAELAAMDQEDVDAEKERLARAKAEGDAESAYLKKRDGDPAAKLAR